MSFSDIVQGDKGLLIELRRKNFFNEQILSLTLQKVSIPKQELLQ